MENEPDEVLPPVGLKLPEYLSEALESEPHLFTGDAAALVARDLKLQAVQIVLNLTPSLAKLLQSLLSESRALLP